VVTSAASVTLSCSAVQGATGYQFAVENNPAGTWAAYYTYTTSGASKAFSPQTRGIDYRFRVRALVAGSYGAWSSYATFHAQ
jgi:hypothetical protein